MLTRQRKLTQPVDTASAFFNVGKQLISEVKNPGPFRLVGMAAFDLSWRDQPLQLDIFEDSKHRRLETTIDRLSERYGKDVVFRATQMGNPGTISKNGVNLDFLDYRDGERVSKPAD